jgi:predicted lipid-binding transport protein (Tim44 family)
MLRRTAGLHFSGAGPIYARECGRIATATDRRLVGRDWASLSARNERALSLEVLMNRLSSVLAAVVVCALSLSSIDAQARRLGGGRSIGRQSEAVTQRMATPAPAPQSPMAAPGSQGVQSGPRMREPVASTPTPAQPGLAQPARNRWLGPLAGVAAGLGLAALASHFGFGEGLASVMLVLLLAMAVLFVVRLLVSRRSLTRPEMSPAPFGYAGVGQEASVPPWSPPVPSPREPEIVRPPVQQSLPFETAAAPAIPQGFDVDAFLRTAKVQFVRLQAAFDAGQLSDLREFTSPEMFAELSQEIRERNGAANRTDVVTLQAELLDLKTEGNQYLASIRFHGTLREESGAGATLDGPGAQDFDEVWNLMKPVDGTSGWVLAGIQQLA